MISESVFGGRDSQKSLSAQEGDSSIFPTAMLCILLGSDVHQVCPNPATAQVKFTLNLSPKTGLTSNNHAGCKPVLEVYFLIHQNNLVIDEKGLGGWASK